MSKVLSGSAFAVALACAGCLKLLSRGEPDAGAAPDVAPSTTAAEEAAPSATAPVAAATTARAPTNVFPVGVDPKTGACIKGFVVLGPPTTPNQPCFQPCVQLADCPKGLECRSEEAMGRGAIKVCEKPAAGAASGDRFKRNIQKEGQCPAGFQCENPFDGQCTCARTCKTDADCKGVKCKDAETSSGKVCSTEPAVAAKAAASKCKPNELEIDGRCSLQCVSDNDCGTRGKCVSTQFQDPGAGLVNTKVCNDAPASTPTRPSASAAPSAPKPAASEK